jgi:hypothetical protein
VPSIFLFFFFVNIAYVNLDNRLTGGQIKEKDDMANFDWCVLVECDRECDHSIFP